ncbi:MAG: ATP-binding cassette domain-containing protein [Proteobacteria bacterium]|nr:ATP-binding cassette domain-containing protein [Pseudomonadota bacterium]
MSETELPVLSVRALQKHFPVERGIIRRTVGAVKAVDDVSFDIAPGEILALVGESGSGKTTLGRCIVRAIDPTGGEATLTRRDGTSVDLVRTPQRGLRSIRSDMNMIFQDPFSSLSPRMPVIDIIGEPLRAQGIARREIHARVREMAALVGLNLDYLTRYPNAFSGGQRQRICIARALITNPRFIVADEPVSALDVSIQAQILNLLQDMRERLNLSYLFITHDLSVVEHMADRVAVMYIGRIVELAPKSRLYATPRHPYTEALLSAVLRPDPEARDQPILLTGESASPAAPPQGCHFHPRCRYAQDICRTVAPQLTEVAPGHASACHLSKELALRGVGTA